MAGEIHGMKWTITSKENHPRSKNYEDIAYILHVRQLSERNSYELGGIIAMDETLVYYDILAGTTVNEKCANSVVMKSTGHDKNRITVVLIAKARVGNVSGILYFLGRNVLFKLEKRSGSLLC